MPSDTPLDASAEPNARPPVDLDRFPRPGVTVDLAVLTVTDAYGEDPQLRLLVQERTAPTGLALPGGFMRERWTVARTTADVLERKVGIALPDGAHPRLLRVFDDPDRDDRTWALSVAHALCLPERALSGARGELVPIRADGTPDVAGPLLFDHATIVADAVAGLRERYEIRQRLVDARPDPDGFLDAEFTLLQLRRVHEAVVGDELHKDNFARRMQPFLEPVTGADGEVVLSSAQRGRPARLFRRADDHPGGARHRSGVA